MNVKFVENSEFSSSTIFQKSTIFSLVHRLAWRMSLLTHVKFVHGQQNQQVCHICARVYSSPASLRRHLKEHSGVEEPRITCKICGRSCKNEIALRKHMTIHEDEGKSFPCPDCQKVYSNRMTLAAHVRGNHSFKLHKCHLCDKEFKRAITLKVCLIHMNQKLGKLIISTSIFRNTWRRIPAHFYTIAIIVRKNSSVLAIYIPTIKNFIQLNGVSIDINPHGNKSFNWILHRPNASNTMILSYTTLAS